MRRYKSIFALSLLGGIAGAASSSLYSEGAVPFNGGSSQYPLDGCLTTISNSTFMERLVAREKEIQDIRFTYTQSVEILPTQEIRLSRGRVIFQRPNRFRMERETEKETLVSNGKTVFIYQKSRRLCVKKSASEFDTEALFPLEALFGGINALQARFEVSLTTTTTEGTILEIRPRHTTTGGQARGRAHWKMRVFLEKDALPRGFELQTQAVRTRTTLSQIALNRLPSEKEFRLSLPKDVEIFEE